MVTGNGGRTIFNGVLPGTMNFTAAGHTKTTAVELFENEICLIDNFYIPVVNFTANTTSGNVPLPVKFTDLSNGNITMWNWSFGDGTFSNTTLASQRSPTHIYARPGSYTVNLTVRTAAATVSAQRNGYVTVQAGYNTINYTDPAPLHPGTNILVYSDQNDNTSLAINLNDTAVLIALRNMHFNYKATNDPAVFNAQISAPPAPNWTLVIWNEELNAPPGGTYDRIRTVYPQRGPGTREFGESRAEQDRTTLEHTRDLARTGTPSPLRARHPCSWWRPPTASSPHRTPSQLRSRSTDRESATGSPGTTSTSPPAAARSAPRSQTSRIQTRSRVISRS